MDRIADTIENLQEQHNSLLSHKIKKQLEIRVVENLLEKLNETTG